MKKSALILVGIITLFFDTAAQISPDQRVKIDQLFSEWDNPDSPGAALGIIQNGVLTYAKGYGSANLDYQIPLDADSKFYIASDSKKFTAACIALLALEGKLNLDDDVRQYISELPDYGNKITIRHLIHHTSGLPDYLPLLRLSGHSFQNYYNNEQAMRILFRQTGLNFLPGEKYQYTNSGYLLLAEIIDRVSGMSTREYAGQNIFQPLGMSNTFVNDDRSMVIEDRVISYKKESGQWKRFLKNFDTYGAGNVISTINDMYLWDQTFYKTNVGDQEFVDMILTKGLLNNGDSIPYAFGLEHSSYNGMKTIFHGGSFFGFRTEHMIFPEVNVSVILFANVQGFKPAEKIFDIADILLAVDVEDEKINNVSTKPEALQPYNLSEEELQKYASRYYSVELDSYYDIQLKDGTLSIYIRGKEFNTLTPLSTTKFSSNSGRRFTIEFTENDYSRFILTTGRVNGLIFDKS